MIKKRYVFSLRHTALSVFDWRNTDFFRYGIIFQCRYNDTAKLVKETLTNGKLGKVISARCTLTWCKPDSYYSLSDWKGTWDKEGGGVIIDQAIHSLDLANWFIDSDP